MSAEQNGRRSLAPTVVEREVVSASANRGRFTRNRTHRQRVPSLHTVSSRPGPVDSPSPLRRRVLYGYLLAVLLQVAAGALTLQLSVLFPQFTVRGVLCLLVVVVVSLTCGTGPGIFATGFGALMLDLILLPPRFTWTVPSPSQYLNVTIFVAAGCFI